MARMFFISLAKLNIFRKENRKLYYFYNQFTLQLFAQAVCLSIYSEMKLKPVQLLSLWLLPLLLYSCATTKPLAPVKSEADIPRLVQPLSNIDVPVTVDLKNYFVQAENSVSAKYSDNQQPCEGLRYFYTFTRTPFTISGSNNIVNLKFVGSYGFNVSYCAKCAAIFGSGPQCVTPVVSAQCGMDDEAPRRMEISYQTTITILPDYHLKSKTVLYPAPHPIDRCNVFMKNIDVTDKLIQYISGPLNDLGKQVDSKIAGYNIKPLVEQLWKNIATETKVGDVGYVSINPESVRLSNFSLNGSLAIRRVSKKKKKNEVAGVGGDEEGRVGVRLPKGGTIFEKAFWGGVRGLILWVGVIVGFSGDVDGGLDGDLRNQGLLVMKTIDVAYIGFVASQKI